MSQHTATILIIEDDPALSDAFGMMLTHGGYQTENAYNGQEALEYLRSHTPDMIILDILMPVMDGREFLQQFKNPMGIPILVLSNLDAKDEIERVTELGATRYMLKSGTTPPVLIKTVAEMIHA